MTNFKDLIPDLLKQELIRRGFSDVVWAIEELEKDDDFLITEDDMLDLISEAGGCV